MKQLLILDDGIVTYNAYKSNTIRISQWKMSMKNDRALLDALDVIEQLNNYRQIDVAKDLHYIIETMMMYKNAEIIS